ncbi:MAG: FAD-dependent oxidoreductase, partial [Aquabacterium sp.]|nr:FAD-dependent oxidoreductase [Ferruginibacter sp.]
ISVGDYPVDHHHKKNPAAPQHLDFYPVPSFNIPLGALIPVSFTGIIIAEKGISASNIVNGASRLQPCVLLTGQAAGTLAALCIQQKKQAAEVKVRDVQQQLLNSNAYIMSYVDVTPASVHFQSIQRLGATGILKGKPEPYKWENRTWFYPDSFVNTQLFIADFKPFAHLEICCNEQLTIENASQVLMVAGKKINPKNRLFNFEDGNKLNEQLKINWAKWGLQNFDTNRKITRAELAVLLDKTIDPFQWMQVTHSGKFVLSK